MKFSQKQVDDTIIPKMEMSEMTKKPVSVGKELVKRTKNLNKNIESVMGKMAKPKSASLPMSDGFVMYLYDAGDKRNKYIRLDFNDYANYDDFYMIVDREKLKRMADFINNYLENK